MDEGPQSRVNAECFQKAKANADHHYHQSQHREITQSTWKERININGTSMDRSLLMLMVNMAIISFCIGTAQRTFKVSSHLKWGAVYLQPTTLKPRAFGHSMVGGVHRTFTQSRSMQIKVREKEDD
eukprot:5452749-Amphidinium_carterae.1